MLYDSFQRFNLCSIGRRFKDQNPGTYLSTLSTEQPVVREGHWQDTTVEEKVKHEAVHKLEVYKDTFLTKCFVLIHKPLLFSLFVKVWFI